VVVGGEEEQCGVWCKRGKRGEKKKEEVKGRRGK
jgi:hypothetical protein